jgi:acetyl-CoA synthetase
MEQLDWSSIKLFSSTGECSNAEDMLYLMYLGQYKPIIEYCGGTEIGGAYLSSTVIENNYHSVFTTPAMGMNINLLEDGEVAIIPPSIGLSTELVNANHHEVYFANMPRTSDNKLQRRHGDQICILPNGYYSILGRADDTMNLGGIKISAADIERCIAGLSGIIEVAAIAISPPGGGPSRLVIYAATQLTLDKSSIMKEMQQRIHQHLNPLFKIHDVVFVKALPKTASNKIMRRVLRQLISNHK